MDEVGILGGVHAAGFKPYLPLLVVHAIDAAHYPGALCDLILDFAGFSVKQIEVFPSIAFRGPDDLLAVGRVMAEFLAGVVLVHHQRPIVDESIALLRDQRASVPCLRVDFDNPIQLVAALVVFESETTVVLPPHERRQLEWIGEKSVINGDFLFRGDIEEHRLRKRQHVPGLWVNHRRILRLELIRRRRLHIVHQPVISGADTISYQELRIRRPDEGAERVIVVFRAVLAQSDFLFTVFGPYADVVILHIGQPLAIRRRLRLPGIVHRPRSIVIVIVALVLFVAGMEGPGAGAGPGVQIAVPAHAFHNEFDRGSIGDETKARERQGGCLVVLAAGRRQGGSQLVVIEGGLFCLRGRVDQHELVAAFYGLPVNEDVGRLLPHGRLREIDDQRFILLLDGECPFEVRFGWLPMGRTPNHSYRDQKESRLDSPPLIQCASEKFAGLATTAGPLRHRWSLSSRQERATHGVAPLEH